MRIQVSIASTPSGISTTSSRRPIAVTSARRIITIGRARCARSRRIRVPTLLLSAEDDPMVPPRTFADPSIQENPNLSVVISKHGGHCAFLSADAAERHWAEARVVEFCAERSKLIPPRGPDSSSAYRKAKGILAIPLASQVTGSSRALAGAPGHPALRPCRLRAAIRNPPQCRSRAHSKTSSPVRAHPSNLVQGTDARGRPVRSRARAGA